MKVDKKWLGGLMFGAVLFAAAGNSSYAGYESGNMWESLSDVFSQYGIVSYAAEISSVDLSQVKKSSTETFGNSSRQETFPTCRVRTARTAGASRMRRCMRP